MPTLSKYDILQCNLEQYEMDEGSLKISGPIARPIHVG